MTNQTSTHEFKAETKKLLDIVINSLYTERDVFIRELVSNAADALEKFRHQSLSEDDVFDSHVPLEITIDVDDTNHTLTITDTGIGMTREELESARAMLAESDSEMKALSKTMGADDRGVEQQMLSKALEVEIETSAYYQKLVNELPEDARLLFERFLEIENNHIVAVQFELDYMSKTGYWFDFKEFDME